MDQETETTFWELISRHCIEIPIIQRDYAQGRDNAKAADIRKGFVARLKSVLTRKETEPLHLNFVYGKLKGVKYANKQASGQQAVKAMLSAAKAYSNDLGLKLDYSIEPSSANDNGQHATSFVPLDGQQRLTTLYLLHWYLLQRLKKTDELSNLKNFTYRVRPSSKDFCAALSEKPVEIKEDIMPSRQIKDAPWYFSYWSKDPTVSGMLRMLDEIHHQFKNEEPAQVQSAWESLTQEKKVTFSFLDLKEHQLTDDLYIRMNARGKPLTEFENFKAWLIDYVHQEKITIEPEDWKIRLDTIWTDLFWANKADNDYTVDRAYLNFFRNMAQIFLVREDSFKPDGTSDDTRENRRNASMLATDKRQDEYVYVPNSFYKELGVFAEENLNELFAILDQLSEELFGQDHLESCIADVNFFYDEKDASRSLFKRFVGGGMSYPDKVRFYGLMQYLLTCKQKNIDPQESSLFSWMRVVRNLVENSQIDSIETFSRAIKSIRNIGEGCLDIYAYLEVDKTELTGFAREQVTEERTKAKLIRKDIRWEEKLLEAENHSVFRGYISFLLPGKENEDIYYFENISEAAREVFREGSEYRNEYLLMRAVLTEMETNTNKIILQDTRQNWQSLLQEEKIQQAVYSVLKKLLNKENKSAALQQIVNDFQNEHPLWRYYIVKNPALLNSHTNTRQVKEYWGQYYLYNKQTWKNNENQILLSNYRNEIIAQSCNDLGLKNDRDDEWWVIKGEEHTFYRGRIITLRAPGNLEIEFHPGCIRFNTQDGISEELNYPGERPGIKESLERIKEQISKVNTPPS